VQILTTSLSTPRRRSRSRDGSACHLGKPKFEREIAERTSIAGVATPAFRVSYSADPFSHRDSRMPGKGNVEITGRSGRDEGESARAALTYVRATPNGSGIQAGVVEGQDVHIHVPAGAVPKDGSSAPASPFHRSSRCSRAAACVPDTAMTW
jgi:ATP-dependent Lon protease